MGDAVEMTTPPRHNRLTEVLDCSGLGGAVPPSFWI